MCSPRLQLISVPTAPSQPSVQVLEDEELLVTVQVSPHLSSRAFTGYQ